MTWYLEAVKAHPILMAVIQFAILGTLGEFVAAWIINKRFFLPFKPLMVLWKMVVWSILAVLIKYAFAGNKGYVAYLVDHHYWPAILGKEGNRVLHAFTLSVSINFQFGILLVLLHRVLDNLVVKVKNWQNLDKALYSLMWFWIPAHTVTFSLPVDYQIGLAAFWSVFLGGILGFMRQKK